MIETAILFLQTYWKPGLEILFLWILIYHALVFFEGTRAIQVWRGIIVLLAIFFLVQYLSLNILNWIFDKLLGISVLAIMVIFHPEIRQGLARLGQHNMFRTPLREEELDIMLKELGKAVEGLCRDKFGALIAIEKSDPLTPFIETGDRIDALVTSDLLHTIFTPNSMLHDGGVIIQSGRIAAAGCLFPLTQNQDLSRVFGTRHRAALGLSEETDALIIVISEERHDVSLVHESRLYKDLSKDELLVKIKNILNPKG
ncbi:MAG TPA: diadenylate cyclase CdaA [Candidatus Omnitrophota bacterium]|nr:diadenylate cyclase CdaA [Candidatus Omnitrophota bacterium]HNQ50986.1 diadenylate cyclase CdaA [Candidatus Omnitrophota bacterium]HQO38459.1 diadenylate cyclase CdaA [Candidatus Omnitrophota bacterium]HQQ06667.1 diadenylate cyclase CdaA [Candidatus Omnitrophota bacterium]